MTIDTKLREAAASVREARRNAHFTVTSPVRQRHRVSGWRIAGVAAVVALLLVGIPALVGSFEPDAESRDVAGSTGDNTETSGPADEVVEVATTDVMTDASGVAAPDAPPPDFPFLAILAAGWYPTYALETSEGGFSAEINYEYMTEDGSGGLIVLRVQAEGPFDRFAGLVSVSASSETLAVAGRDMTLHHVPQASIPEDTDSDAYAASWTEADGSEGYAIAFGLERQEFIDALAGIEPIPEEAWLELTLVHSAATTTTMVEPADNGETP